jgi:hypothetical protein
MENYQQDPEIKKMIDENVKRQQWRGRLVLMAYRCGYIEPIEENKLRIRKWLPAWVWRIYFGIVCIFSVKWHDDMLELLRFMAKKEKRGQARKKNH